MDAAAEARFLYGRRCLIAGGTGFVGSHFVDALRAAGVETRVAARRATGRSGAADVVADFRDREACLRALEGVDVLIHAAGGVGAAGTGAAAILAGSGDTVQITANLLWAAAQAGVRDVLLFSSSTGYPPADHPVREEEFWSGEVHPAYQGYGWMRRYVEKLAEFATAQCGLRVVVVRPGAVYGPRDNFGPAGGHVVASLIRRAAIREAPFTVWGSGEEVRDFLHVRDLVRGCLLALEKAAPCDPVNIAAGQAVSVRELAAEVLAASGYGDAEVRFDATAPTTIGRRLIDIGKARRILGFEPRITLREGLAETVRWYDREREKGTLGT